MPYYLFSLPRHWTVMYIDEFQRIIDAGQQIKTLRKQLHFTQKQLASCIDVARKTVVKWENKYHRPICGIY